MITYTTASTTAHLQGILQLQQQNLPENLDTAEKEQQGFVTVQHTLTDLEKLNRIEPHVIALENDTVAAYLLAMTAQSGSNIPVLKPMFESFEHILWKGAPVAQQAYMVVGQVCVAKACRGKGILNECYNYYHDYFSTKYSFAVTEIDLTNQRSINAHRRIGFEEVHRYPAPNGVQWSVVLWNWR
jgi:predicted GNAT superfamily acetyltransferase